MFVFISTVDQRYSGTSFGSSPGFIDLPGVSYTHTTQPGSVSPNAQSRSLEFLQQPDICIIHSQIFTNDASQFFAEEKRLRASHHNVKSVRNIYSLDIRIH